MKSAKVLALFHFGKYRFAANFFEVQLRSSVLMSCSQVLTQLPSLQSFPIAFFSDLDYKSNFTSLVLNRMRGCSKVLLELKSRFHFSLSNSITACIMSIQCQVSLSSLNLYKSNFTEFILNIMRGCSSNLASLLSPICS